MIKKILIVDDEPHILNSMKELLELEDKEVQIAENGKVALELIGKEKFDLIISDAKMPQMNGQELLAEVRRDDTKVKFIILTGESEFSQEKLKSIGADAVFYKPLDFDILVETIGTF
tara:strand:- start:175 stop:525 length:351 start_codon:yes stop_codon:yes gene_type:complete